VVWQHDQARLQHDVIGIGDVQSDTVYGRLLVRSLTRAQLGLSLMCLALAAAVIAAVPVIMALLPRAHKITVAGNNHSVKVSGQWLPVSRRHARDVRDRLLRAGRRH